MEVPGVLFWSGLSRRALSMRNRQLRPGAKEAGVSIIIKPVAVLPIALTTTLAGLASLPSKCLSWSGLPVFICPDLFLPRMAALPCSFPIFVRASSAYRSAMGCTRRSGRDRLRACSATESPRRRTLQDHSNLTVQSIWTTSGCGGAHRVPLGRKNSLP